MLQKFAYALVLCGAVLVTACSKDESGDPVPTGGGGSPLSISNPPTSFTQKVLLEYHTASWCGTCPDADTKRDQLVNTYPGKVIPVAIHQADSMQIGGFFTIDATFGSSTGYGMVNRTPSLNNVLLNRTQWMSNATVALSRQATSGLAILSAVAGNTAVIEVQGAFLATQTGRYNLTVWLTEMEVTGSGTGYDQVNTYNTDPSSAWYNLGNPITGFKHQYVWRKSLTAVLGDSIPGASLTAGGLVKKNFTVDVSGMNKDHVYVVAFINKLGDTPSTHGVVNVQTAKLGELKDWN